jgi:hypothetical protein
MREYTYSEAFTHGFEDGHVFGYNRGWRDAVEGKAHRPAAPPAAAFMHLPNPQRPPGYDAGFDAGFWKGTETGYARGWEDAVGRRTYHPNPMTMEEATASVVWLNRVNDIYKEATGRSFMPLEPMFPWLSSFRAGMTPEHYATVELPRMMQIATVMMG